MDELHIEGYAVFFFLIGLIQPLVWGILIVYLWKLKHRIKWLVFLSVSMILSICFFLLNPQQDILDINSEVKVIEIQESLYHDILTVKYHHQKYHIKTAKGVYQLGNHLMIQGDIVPYREQTIPFGFNEKVYYLSQGVYGIIEVRDIEFIKKGFSLLSFRSHLLNQVHDLSTASYIKSLIFGEKSLPHEQQTLFRDLGISYLLTASGLHIYVLLSVLKHVFFNLSIKEDKVEIIILLFLGFLAFLSYQSLGVTRLLIMHTLLICNRRLSLDLSRLDLIQVTFLIMIIFNIHLIYHQGLLITYLILNVIYLMEFRYRGFSNYLKKLYLTLLIQLVMIPYTLKISIIVVLLMPAIIFFVTTFLYTGAFLVFVMPFLDDYYLKLTQAFEVIMGVIEMKKSTLFLPALYPWQMMVYYLFVMILLRYKTLMDLILRVLIISSLFLSIVFFRNQQEEVIFIDVGQGDSVLMISDGCHILIDNFRNVNAYLKNRGVYELDFLILTHSHQDHIRETHQIIDDIKVQQIILSAYDQGYPYYNIATQKVKSGDQLTCQSLKLNILGPIQDYASTNNQSIVIQTKIAHQTFLFTGDIEIEAEKDLVNRYQHQLKSDVLKVSHHGSKTSSSDLFLSYVQPEVVIISLGMANKYLFPHEEALINLMKYTHQIYRTDLHGSIQFLPSRKKEKWQFNLPF